MTDTKNIFIEPGGAEAVRARSWPLFIANYDSRRALVPSSCPTDRFRA